MERLRKTALIAFALTVFVIAVHFAEARTEKVNSLTEAFAGLKQAPYTAVVIPGSSFLF